MTRKSPQEKKALSYAKDHGNSYGENIFRNERDNVRADRRREQVERLAARRHR